MNVTRIGEPKSSVPVQFWYRTVTQFVCQDIISYCDINTKYIMKRIHKQFANIKIILDQPEYDKTKKWLLKYLLAIKITRKQYFRDKNILRDGLDYACLRNNAKIVESLSKIMAETHDINMLNKGLRCACFCGKPELINILIKYGAIDWNLGLSGACESGNFETGKLMIKYGADGKHCENRIFHWTIEH